jgi:hypothetical protein
MPHVPESTLNDSEKKPCTPVTTSSETGLVRGVRVSSDGERYLIAYDVHACGQSMRAAREYLMSTRNWRIK